MSADDSLLSQMEACSTPIYMTERAEIIAYYQEEYEDDWKSEIVTGLAPIANLGQKSLARRFQGGRENSPRVSAKQREEYRQLGLQLPPAGYEPPTNGYLITFVGSVRISGKCYPKHFTVHLVGEDAEALASGDVDAAWEAIFFLYFEEDLAEGYCDEPSVTLTAY